MRMCRQLRQRQERPRLRGLGPSRPLGRPGPRCHSLVGGRGGTGRSAQRRWALESRYGAEEGKSQTMSALLPFWLTPESQTLQHMPFWNTGKDLRRVGKSICIGQLCCAHLCSCVGRRQQQRTAALRGSYEPPPEPQGSRAPPPEPAVSPVCPRPAGGDDQEKEGNSPSAAAAYVIW